MLLLLFVASSAEAQEAPTSINGDETAREVVVPMQRSASAGLRLLPTGSVYQQLTDLERRLVDLALAEFGFSLELYPEGKTIGQIHIKTFDVFQEGDIFPDFLNLFHYTTRKSVIRQRLTLEPGSTWQRVLVDDARRWMLDESVFSTAVIVPVKSDSPDEVDILVVTKDIWSLRLNSDFQVTGTTLDYLAVSISENNFLGFARQLALSFLLEPDVWSLGPTYVDKQLFGSRLVLSQATKFVHNRDSGAFEGAFGSIAVGLPFYRRDQEWGWSLAVDFNHTIHRELLAGEVIEYPFQAEEGTPTIPWQWRERFLDVSASVTRSIGTRFKNDLSWGWRFLWRNPEIPRSDDFTPELVQDFKANAVPRRRRDSYPIFRWRLWENTFRQLQNVQTLGFTEDFQVGHDITLSAGMGNPATGSDGSFVVAGLTAGYTGSPLSTDLASILFEFSTRLEGSEWLDFYYLLTLSYSTPVLWIGRFHFGGFGEIRQDDPDNFVVTLGGDSGLRGYPSARFRGNSRARVNAEFRSLPVELWTTFLGFALFWDGGTIWEDGAIEDAMFYHDTGLGFRLVIPQAQRLVIRGDWAFPLDAARSFFPGQFSLGFEQAF